MYNLLQAVKDIGDWNGLCTNLKVDDGIMDGLRHSEQHHERKKDACLRAYWNGGKATWTEVIQAVAMYPINNERIARKIANEYHIDFDKVIMNIKDEF